jgi:hypothetical protein
MASSSGRRAASEAALTALRVVDMNVERVAARSPEIRSLASCSRLDVTRREESCIAKKMGTKDANTMASAIFSERLKRTVGLDGLTTRVLIYFIYRTRALGSDVGPRAVCLSI